MMSERFIPPPRSDKYVNRIRVIVTDEYCHAFALCRGGHLFEASGKPRDVDNRRKRWDKTHLKCEGPDFE